MRFEDFLKEYHLEDDFQEWLDKNAEKLIFCLLTSLAKIIYNSKEAPIE